MMQKLGRKVWVLGALYLAWACSDQTSTDMSSQIESKISVVDGRVKFADNEAFYQTLKSLDGMNQSERSKWASDLGHTTMQSYFDQHDREGGEIPKDQEIYYYYGMSLKFILNSNGLLQIGNDVVLYKDQTKYYMDVDQYNALEDKSKIVDTSRRGKYRITVFATNEDPNSAARSWDAPTDGNYGSGGDMHEFQLGDGSWRKFTTVFIGHSDGGLFYDYCNYNPEAPYYYFWNDLYLLLKLEGRTRKSRPWSLANESRVLTWNVTLPQFWLYGPDMCGSWVLLYVGGSNTPFSGSTTTSDANYWISIVPTFGTSGSDYPDSWGGSVTGTVEHNYVGVEDYTLTF